MGEKMRVVLIGAGDIEFHYKNLLKLNEEDIDKHTKDIANALVEADAEIVLLPDRGFCLEVAKKYKEIGGKKVIGLVPKSDKKYGITHLKKYMELKINNEFLFDEFINSGDWYSANQTHCLFGENILMLGTSTGTLGELCFGYYVYKLFLGHKVEVEIDMKKHHAEFVAGSRIPLDTIIYAPLIIEKLPVEIEKYVEKFGTKIIYVKNFRELKKIFSK
jgi:hypothetical protein